MVFIWFDRGSGAAEDFLLLLGRCFSIDSVCVAVPSGYSFRPEMKCSSWTALVQLRRRAKRRPVVGRFLVASRRAGAANELNYLKGIDS